MQMAVAQKMAGVHAELLDEVERIRDKHKDIVRLERSINELHQMCIEMAALVDAHGEMLDSIEVHVHKTNVYTAKAETELIAARKAQHTGQRRFCCMSICMLVVL